MIDNKEGGFMEKYFEQLVLSRQSCRNFNDKPIEKEKLQKIASLARLCPSACNSQPWQMYVVTEEESVKKTAEALGLNGHNKFLDKAKAFIVPVEKQAVLKAGVKFDRNHFVKYDMGELIAYITLGAESMGIKSCIIGMVDQEKLKQAIGLSETDVCNVAVALGYSDAPLREKVRKLEEEIIKTV